MDGRAAAGGHGRARARGIGLARPGPHHIGETSQRAPGSASVRPGRRTPELRRAAALHGCRRRRHRPRELRGRQRRRQERRGGVAKRPLLQPRLWNFALATHAGDVGEVFHHRLLAPLLLGGPDAATDLPPAAAPLARMQDRRLHLSPRRGAWGGRLDAPQHLRAQLPRQLRHRLPAVHEPHGARGALHRVAARRLLRELPPRVRASQWRQPANGQVVAVGPGGPPQLANLLALLREGHLPLALRPRRGRDSLLDQRELRGRRRPGGWRPLLRCCVLALAVEEALAPGGLHQPHPRPRVAAHGRAWGAAGPQRRPWP
mmetsp:Transcript_54791/g.175690  ORF Transcript_54791/g.175690 Transcript_54791/m.175690 type:complete len:317 (+) Transcript_54791:16-966(+)